MSLINFYGINPLWGKYKIFIKKMLKDFKETSNLHKKNLNFNDLGVG
jgi:hypothetical protein